MLAVIPLVVFAAGVSRTVPLLMLLFNDQQYITVILSPPSHTFWHVVEITLGFGIIYAALLIWQPAAITMVTANRSAKPYWGPHISVFALSTMGSDYVRRNSSGAAVVLMRFSLDYSCLDSFAGMHCTFRKRGNPNCRRARDDR